MTINLQDNNLIVSYLQIFLRDYFGVSLESDGSVAKIVSNTPLKVTGTYRLSDYESLSLFMMYNYPREGYPTRYDYETVEGKSVEIKTPFKQEDIILVCNTILNSGFDLVSNDLTESDYNNIKIKEFFTR